MRRRRVLVAGLLLTVLGITVAQAGIQVGGDLKLRMFDWKTGTSTMLDTLGNPVDYQGSGFVNMGFYAAYLFFSGQLSDRVSISIEPEIGARTGATPRIGQPIEANSPTSPEIDISKAYMDVLLPWDVELSAGAIRPMFCVDYGAEKWYQEQATITWGTHSGYLGAIHDYGIELYKPFEFEAGNSYFSMPTYLYVTSGYGSDAVSDNNGDKQLMVHIEPGIGPVQVFGSAGLGKWDDDGMNGYFRYAGGLALNFEPFWLRAEYMGGTWTNRFGSTDEMFDAKPVGYYAKVGVHITDWLGLVAWYGHEESNWIGNASGTDKGDQIAGVINCQVIPGSHLMLQVEKSKQVRSTGEGIDFLRTYLMWRTIF